VKGKNRRKDNTVAGEAVIQALSIDAILAQLASMKDNSRSFIDGRDPEADAIWAADVTACEAATAILSALQDEGVRTPEEVRDLVHDYNALAEQYQSLHQKYEVEDKPVRLGNTFICPACNRQIRQLYAAHCWSCGKRLGWGR